MRSVAGVIGLAVVLLAVNTAVAQETKRAGSVARVAIVPVEGEINPGTEEALKRRLKHALDDGAEVILVAVDSPGGRLDSCKNMCDMLMAAVREGHGAVRTVAYVKSQAISAAAIISLSCQEIVMLEGTLIGDAQAVMAIPGKGPQVAPEKAQTFVRSLIRNVAQVNKYPEAVVEAMVDADLEVYKITFPDGSVKYVRKQELEAVERRAAKQEVKTEKKAPTAEAVQSVKPMAPDVLPRKGFKKQLEASSRRYRDFDGKERNPTINIGGVFGGSSGDKENTVPGRAFFSIDRRILPVENLNQAEKELRRALARAAERRPRTRCEIRASLRIVPCTVDPEHPLPQSFARAVQRVRRHPARFKTTTGFTDLHYFVEEGGLPGIGYGVNGERMHGVDERVKQRDLLQTARTYAEFMLRGIQAD